MTQNDQQDKLEKLSIKWNKNIEKDKFTDNVGTRTRIYDKKPVKRLSSVIDSETSDEEICYKIIKRDKLFVNKLSDKASSTSSDNESNDNVTDNDNNHSANSTSSSSSSSSSSCSKSSRKSIPKRQGSPNFKERRRITSARKKPTPYDRAKFVKKSKRATSYSSSSSDQSRSTTPDSPFIRRTLKEHCLS